MTTAKKPGTAKTAVAKKPASAKPAASIKASVGKAPAAKSATSKNVTPIAPKVTVTPAKAPAAKKTVAAKPKPKTAATATAAKANSRKPVISPEQRANYIEVAAFYIAERRGFAPGNPIDDWVAAEAEIDRLIASGKFAR